MEDGEFEIRITAGDIHPPITGSLVGDGDEHFTNPVPDEGYEE